MALCLFIRLSKLLNNLRMSPQNDQQHNFHQTVYHASLLGSEESLKTQRSSWCQNLNL